MKTKRQICYIYELLGDTTTICRTCTWEGSLDFANKIYYVELVMLNPSFTPSGSLEHISIY